MSLICIIAAGGLSGRTGLGTYTNKAALSLGGRTLLQHQIDFCARSGANRAFVIVRPEHVRLLASQIAGDELRRVAFIVSDCASGWAGEVERAAAFVLPDDEVILISCDNLHACAAQRLGLDEAIFTYTTWDRRDVSPTQGPVLGREGDVWAQRPGVGFVGDLFTGYAVVRGVDLVRTLREIPSSARGEKEITALLEALTRTVRCRIIPYPGTYDDVMDLPALARFNARARGSKVWQEKVTLGAGVVLHDEDRIFLTEREDGRGWVFPGGVVEAGRTFIETACREVWEEVGVPVEEDDLRLLGVYPTVGKQGEPACSVLFHTEDSFEDLYLDPKEVKSAGWFTREEAEKLVIPFDMGGAVSDYFEGRELDVRK
mgnify:CR=1 FL=1